MKKTEELLIYKKWVKIKNLQEELKKTTPPPLPPQFKEVKK